MQRRKQPFSAGVPGGFRAYTTIIVARHWTKKSIKPVVHQLSGRAKRAPLYEFGLLVFHPKPGNSKLPGLAVGQFFRQRARECPARIGRTCGPRRAGFAGQPIPGLGLRRPGGRRSRRRPAHNRPGGQPLLSSLIRAGTVFNPRSLLPKRAL